MDPLLRVRLAQGQRPSPPLPRQLHHSLLPLPYYSDEELLGDEVELGGGCDELDLRNVTAQYCIVARHMVGDNDWLRRIGVERYIATVALTAVG